MDTATPTPQPTCSHCGEAAPLMVCGWNADGSDRLRCADEAACIARWLPAEHPAHADRIRAAFAAALVLPEVA